MEFLAGIQGRIDTRIILRIRHLVLFSSVVYKNINYGRVCNVTLVNSPKIYTLLAFGSEMYLHFITTLDPRL